jgi:hypothetical protein
VQGVLEQLALFRRVAAMENRSPQSRLRGRVAVELSTQGTGTGRGLSEGQTVTLTARNNAEVPLYLSVWVLTARLGVQRVYPPQSDCLLLAPGREVRVPLVLRRSDRTRPQERMAFKIFATLHPANLDVLQLPELPPEVVLTGDLLPEPPAAARPPSDHSQPTPGDTTQHAGEPGAAAPPSPGGPAALTAKLWRPGQRLRVRFLDGDRRLHAMVAAAARCWSEHGNINFTFDDGPEAEIRVSFKETATWSYIGTDCLHVPKDRPTMNLGWLTPDTPEAEVRRVALLQFGCALGLVLAHRSPVANIPWNRERVYRSLTGPSSDWSPEMIEASLFHKYSPAEVQAGPPDPATIMHDAIPPEWLAAPFPKIGMSTDLSEGDKAFIARVYPFPGQPGEPAA